MAHKIKSYTANGLLGCVGSWKNQKTGTMVSVYHNEQAGLDDEGGAWSTVCEDHGYLVSHSSLSNARSWVAAPDEWCEDCQLNTHRLIIEA